MVQSELKFLRTCAWPQGALRRVWHVLDLGLKAQVLGLGHEAQVLDLGHEAQVLRLGHEAQVLGLEA